MNKIIRFIAALVVSMATGFVMVLGMGIAEDITDTYDFVEIFKKIKKKFSRKIVEVKRKED